MDSAIIERVIQQLKDLPPELQSRVLEFTRSLTASGPLGVPGKQLLRFAGVISSADAQQMREAIEQGCERVDANGW